MTSKFLMGFGVGLVLMPFAGFVNKVPLVGIYLDSYSTIIFILIGVVLIVKGI
ncbi:MAG TPA: hypothetical protein VJB89_04125 [Candidatus Nanoarchaeia archaeon]|nr:hypothetical protein [Candidatus Nanoarchaeia archaeon]